MKTYSGFATCRIRSVKIQALQSGPSRKKRRACRRNRPAMSFQESLDLPLSAQPLMENEVTAVAPVVLPLPKMG